MKPGIPWSVKGIEPEARVAAKKAAQQAGMTLGQWLNRTILTSHPKGSAPDSENADWSPPPSQSDQELAALHEVLTDMAKRFDEVEQNNQEIITHLDRAIDESPDGNLPALGSDLESKILARLEETKQELFGRMETLEVEFGKQLDSNTLKPLAGTLDKIVRHIETSEKRAINGMQAMEQAITHLSQRMDTTERQIKGPSSLAGPLNDLENRIGRVEREARENAESIQERIYEISNVLDNPNSPKNAGTDDFPTDFNAELRIEALEASLHSIMTRQKEGAEADTTLLEKQTPNQAIDSDDAPIEPPAPEAPPEEDLEDIVIQPFGKRRRRSDASTLNLPPVQPVPVPGAAQQEKKRRPTITSEERSVQSAQKVIKETAKARAEHPEKTNKRKHATPPEMEKTVRVKSPIADLILDEEEGGEDDTIKGRIRRGLIGVILLSFIIMTAAAALVILGDGRFSASDTLSKLDMSSALSSLNITMPEDQDPPPATPEDLSAPQPVTIMPAPSTTPLEFGDSTADAALSLLLSPEEMAIEDLKRLSSEDNPWAHYRLGLRFLNGNGITQDEQRGAQLIGQAAQKELAAAQYRLGALYESGTGLKQDFVKARLWYGKSALAGNRKAMYNLGVLYAAGDGVTQDYYSAIGWFTKAANLGLTDSQFNLGALLYRGIGTSHDPVQAYKWFSIAASKGDKDAAEMKAKLESELDSSSLGSAKALISIWRPKPIDKKTNIEF